jgi:hypothetical protein
MVLDLDGHIEEEDLIFGEINFHARSFTEQVVDRFDAKGFSNCGYPIRIISSTN